MPKQELLMIYIVYRLNKNSERKGWMKYEMKYLGNEIIGGS